MKKIQINVTAFSAAAGKYDSSLPKNGNEDNFMLKSDVNSDESNFNSDSAMDLSPCGMVMAVADGMGGMNAGEVASQIAIDTLNEFFGKDKISAEVAASHKERKKYLEKIIDEADKRIKKDAKDHPEHEGLGSTIIIAWIVGDELTLSWCGDSRCYRYNDENGIELLSHDHSYVQELADKGLITYEQTFAHPQGNIVTRGLGDSSSKAQPETRFFNLFKNDIILLCSDGLSGVVFDYKYYSENQLLSNYNIEDVIREHTDSMTQCRDALLEAAERSDWYDNVTVILCKMTGDLPEAVHNETKRGFTETVSHNNKSSNRFGVSLLKYAVAVLVAIASTFFLLEKYEIKPCKEENAKFLDSIGVLNKKLNGFEKQKIIHDLSKPKDSKTGKERANNNVEVHKASVEPLTMDTSGKK